MLQGIYKGLPQSELEDMQVKVLTQLSSARSGGQITQVTMGGKSVSKSVASVEELKTELAEVRLALKSVAPEIYGSPRRNFRFDYRARAI